MASIKLVYINSTGGYVQSSSTGDEASGLGKLTLAGVGGVAIDAGGAAVTNLGTPSNNSDAATKSYVDSLVNGLTWVSPVVVVATSAVTLSGSQTIDGVTPINGSRVLITGQNGSTPDAANGIYLVNTSGAWSRSSDTLRSGTAMFVQSGSTYADTQWVLTTDAVITPGVTAIIFAQAGAGVSYSAGDGINIVGTTISAKGDSTKAINVDATNGIQVVVDTNYGLSIDATNGLRVDLATNPGLEFSSGNLQVKVASADQLALDASGVNVVGVPSQFKINGSAVSTNVTATNLNALTDSASITALHRHGQIFTTGTVATGGVGSAYPVYFNTSGEVATAAASSTLTAGVVGIAINTYSAGATAVVQTHGECTVFSGLTVGAPYYLDDSGGAVELYSTLTSGNRAIRIGYAKSATTIILNIQDMGVKP